MSTTPPLPMSLSTTPPPLPLSQLSQAPGGPIQVVSSAKPPKKLKYFFDTSVKFKTRLSYILDFLRSTPPELQAQAYKDFPEQMIYFLIEYHTWTISRLVNEKDYYSHFLAGLEYRWNKSDTSTTLLPLPYSLSLQNIKSITKEQQNSTPLHQQQPQPLPFISQQPTRKDGEWLIDHWYFPLLLNTTFSHLADCPLLSCSSLTNQLVRVIKVLLHPGNHPSLRRDGVEALLRWLRISPHLKDLQFLFETMIPFNLFVSDSYTLDGSSSSYSNSSYSNSNSNVNAINNASSYFDQHEFPVIVEEEPPMIPSPLYTSLSQIGSITPAILSLFTSFDRYQALIILDSILNFLTTDPQSSKATIVLLWDLLYDRYLSIFFPVINEQVPDSNTVDATRNNNPFYLFPPKPIISLLMHYMSQWILGIPPLKGEQIPLMILKEFFLEDASSTPIILFNNVLQKVTNLCSNGVSYGCSYDANTQDTTIANANISLLLTGHQIIRKWTLSPKDRRPPFLLNSPPSLRQLYISILLSSFRKGTPKPILDSVLTFIKDLILCCDIESSSIINVDNNICDNTKAIAAIATKDFLIEKQHEIALPFLLGNTDKAIDPIIPSLLNSLFYTLILSGKKEHWKSLRDILSSSNCNSPLLVGEWCHLMSCICNDILSLISKSSQQQQQQQQLTATKIFKGDFLERSFEISRPNTPKYNLLALFPSNESNYSLPSKIGDLIVLWRNFLFLLSPPQLPSHLSKDSSSISANLLWTHCLFEMVVVFENESDFLLDLIDPLMNHCFNSLSIPSSPSRLLGHSALTKIYMTICCGGFVDGYATATTTNDHPSIKDKQTPKEDRFILLTLYALSDRDDTSLLAVQLSSLSRLFESSVSSAIILIPPIIRAITTLIRGRPTSTALMEEIIRLCQSIYVVTSEYRHQNQRIGRLEVPLQMMSSIPISLINWMDLNGDSGDALRLQLLDIIHTLPPAPNSKISSILISFLLIVIEIEASIDNTSPVVQKILEILLDLPSMVSDAGSSLHHLLCSSIHERLSLKCKVTLLQKIITISPQMNVPPLFLSLFLSTSLSPAFQSSPYTEIREKVVKYIGEKGGNDDLSKLLSDWLIYPSPLEAYNMLIPSERRISLRDWSTSNAFTRFYAIGDRLIVCFEEDTCTTNSVKVNIINLQGHYSWICSSIVEKILPSQPLKDLPPVLERYKCTSGDPLKEMLLGLLEEHTEERLPPTPDSFIPHDEERRIKDVEEMFNDLDSHVYSSSSSSDSNKESCISKEEMPFYFGKKLLLSLSIVGIKSPLPKQQPVYLLSGQEDMIKDLESMESSIFQIPTMDVGVYFSSSFSRTFFMAFLNSLGWKLSGKLWKYKNEEINLSFHFISPLSPSSPEAQSLREKSKIKIIWSNGDPLPQDVSDGVCLIIEPLKITPDSFPLYCVKYSGSNMGSLNNCGPLYSGSIVGLPVLGSLIRATCINYFLLNHPGKEFIDRRSKMIKDIIGKYRTDGDLLNFSSTISNSDDISKNSNCQENILKTKQIPPILPIHPLK